MGLFWRKKAQIERERKKHTHKIICLYCFRSFSHDRVMFRALHVLDADGYFAERDETLDRYRSRFGFGTAGEIETVLDPDDFAESSKRYFKGILVSLMDDYENVTTRRVCPFCHNDISKDAGFAPTIIFAITGAARAGKSIFFTCLIHHIRTVLPRHFASFCTPVGSETGRTFMHGLASPLLENGILPISALLKEYPDMPLVFSFSAERSFDINIVFFDPAGDSAYMDIHNHLIRSAKGIMLLVDPLSIPVFGKELAEKNDPDFDPLFFTEPVGDLGMMLLEYADDVPIAVVLTKTDLLNALVHENEYFDSLSAVFENFCHGGHFDTSEYGEIDAEVHDFLADVCPNFFNALKRRFMGNLGFFGVSALGRRPVAGHVNDVNPVRIGEPFLWLLYSLGFFSNELPGGEEV